MKFSFSDALDNYDGGSRAVEGPSATGAIWFTYPQAYVSTWNCLGDQVDNVFEQIPNYFYFATLVSDLGTDKETAE